MSKNPIVHFELPGNDLERMKAFYAKAFGWSLNQLGADMNNYVVAMTAESGEDGRPKNNGEINGGFYQKTAEMPPQHPSVVVAVADLAVAMEAVQAAGGTLQGEVVDIPGVGKYASFLDTEGNRLSMLQPNPLM